MRRKPKGAAKIASKVEERGLLDYLATLKESPGVLVPQVRGSGLRFWRIRRIASRIRRVWEAREQPPKLSRKARGKSIDRAYAAALLLTHQGQAPRLAQASMPWGEVKFAIRGMVPKEYHLAVQHADDPRLRALGFHAVARKSGILVYCLADRTIAQARDSTPPEGYLDGTLAGLETDWVGEGTQRACPHPAALRVHVRFPAGVEASVCLDCARELDTPLLATLARPIAGLDARRDVRADVRGLPWTCEHEGACPAEGTRDRESAALLPDYLRGVLSEARLLDEIALRTRDRLTGSDQLLLVAGSRCFGQDLDGFLTALAAADDRERELVRRLVRAKPKALLLEDATVNKALLAYWQEERAAIVTGIVRDADLASDLIMKHRDAPPATVLAEAHRLAESRSALDRLPSYRDLPPILREVDGWVRAHRRGARADATKSVEEARARGEAYAPFCYAFLVASGAHEGKTWQYKPHEVEFGKALAPAIRAMLERDGDEYHAALLRLGREGGVTERVERA